VGKSLSVGVVDRADAARQVALSWRGAAGRYHDSVAWIQSQEAAAFARSLNVRGVLDEHRDWAALEGLYGDAKSVGDIRDARDAREAAVAASTRTVTSSCTSPVAA
jgi:hypothetical protein